MNNKSKSLYKEIYSFVHEERPYRGYYTHNENQAVRSVSKKLLKLALDEKYENCIPFRYWFYIHSEKTIEEMIIEETEIIEKLSNRPFSSNRAMRRVKEYHR